MNIEAPPDRLPRTLERWMNGPRFRALPARGAGHPPPLLSFEFFPPRTEALEQQLWTCIRRLEPLAPRFVSVTYGAGGTTQARTHATVARLVTETSLVPAAHLTCVGATREEVDAVARQYWAGRGAPRGGAARRPAAGAARTSRIRAAMRSPPTWWRGCAGWRISRSRWRRIRRRIRAR